MRALEYQEPILSEPPATLLIVDDISDNIQVLNAILRGDYKLKAAPNGQRALELARQSRPDLILLDIMMPGMDGYEVCRQLKADPATAPIPIIFITAKSDETDETFGFELGAVDYITKPIRPPVVQARVRTHVRLRRAQQQLEAQKVALEEAARLRDDVERITHHDLKTPLNSIIGIPGILSRRYEFADKDLELLRGIERSGHKMLNMINRSLDLYKMEIGAYRSMAQPMDLLPVLRSILNEVTHSPGAADKAWCLRIDGEIAGDRAQFWANAETMLCYSMFANLVQNAFEASPIGATVELDLEQRDERALLHITNEGAVPASIRASFFDKYVTHGKHKGTGLGTYSAKLCAEMQGGAIAMETMNEAHTCVTVSLPVITRQSGQ